MTYFGFLDKASIFSVLLRLDILELDAIVIARPYLKKLRNSPHFKEKWKEYHGIRTVQYITRPNQQSVYRHIEDINKNYHKHGVSLKLDMDSMRAVESMEYYRGLQHGKHVKYYTNGTTVHWTCTYRFDKKHGIERIYNDNIIWIEYADGQRHGKCLTWHANGCLSTIFQCKNDHIYGTERKYYDNGQQSHEIIDGTITKRWDRQGEPISQYTNAFNHYNN